MNPPDSSRIEPLESRLALAKLVAVDGANHLFIFDDGVDFDFQQIDITGLSAGESVQALDFRPANDRLYGLALGADGSGKIYRLDATSGLATIKATLRPDPADSSAPFARLSGTRFDMDFNPASDVLRVVSDTGQNLRVRPATGFVVTDDALAFAPGDANEGQTLAIRGIGYGSGAPGSTGTKLFALDDHLGVLAAQNPRNAGTLDTIGSFQFFNPQRVDGFDAAPGTNEGYATAVLDGATELARIDLATGHLFPGGILSHSDLDLRSLAVIRYRWTGAGADGKTSNAANWTPHLPLAGDAEIFLPAGVTNKAITNDSGVFFPLASIVIEGSGYSLRGGALSVGSIVATNATGTNRIGASDRVLHTSGTLVSQSAGALLAFPGAIDPDGGTVKLGGAGDFEIHSLEGTGTLLKTGAGKAVVGLSTLRGAYIVRKGTLILNFVNPGSTASVEGGVLGGGLFPDTIATGGVISPGDRSRTELTVQGGFNLGRAATLAIQIEGAKHDSVRIFPMDGDELKLAGTLSLTRIGTEPFALSYTILDNRSAEAIRGTFAGLPQGAELIFGSTIFRISYTGGDGNDVVLKRLGARSGNVATDGSFTKIAIGGAVASGLGLDSGSLFAAGALGTMQIGGDLSGTSASLARIVAGGLHAPGSLALTSIEVGGRMSFAEVLGGYTLAGSLQAGVNFGSIIVRGSWEASSLAVGVARGPDGGFGTGDDAAMAGGIDHADRLARVLIGGAATGTAQPGDNFGISARRIGALIVASFSVPLTAALDVRSLSATGDFFAREVPAA